MEKKIILNSPYKGSLDNFQHPFEEGSLKESIFRLLITNTFLFESPADLVYSLLSEKLDTGVLEIEKELLQLEMELDKHVLVQ